MAIPPVAHQSYLTQLFQPSATGNNQRTDQTTTTDQLDGIINSVKQHTFKVPEWMQQIYGVSSEVSDLGALASAIQSKRVAEFNELARQSIEQLKKAGHLDAAAEYERSFNQNANSNSDAGKIAGFVVKGNAITGFVQNDGALAVGDPQGADARIYWGKTNELDASNPYQLAISKYLDKIVFV